MACNFYQLNLISMLGTLPYNYSTSYINLHTVHIGQSKRHPKEKVSGF